MCSQQTTRSASFLFRATIAPLGATSGASSGATRHTTEAEDDRQRSCPSNSDVIPRSSKPSCVERASTLLAGRGAKCACFDRLKSAPAEGAPPSSSLLSLLLSPSRLLAALPSEIADGPSVFLLPPSFPLPGDWTRAGGPGIGFTLRMSATKNPPMLAKWGSRRRQRSRCRCLALAAVGGHIDGCQWRLRARGMRERRSSAKLAYSFRSSSHTLQVESPGACELGEPIGTVDELERAAAAGEQLRDDGLILERI